jgi:hypothetical protein
MIQLSLLLLVFASEGGAVHAEDPNATATIPVEELNEQDGETVTVIGRGVGLDLESARKDALKRAVEQAVGLLVDAETILENNEIIETILTYSGAYIEKYEELETKKEDSGLFRVKVKAEVMKTQLLEKLVEGKVDTKKVDGKSIFAKARSRMDEKYSSALLFRRVFEGFPLNVMRATFEEEEELVRESETSVGLGVKVRIEIDPKAWASWVKKFERTLGSAARSKGTFRPRDRHAESVKQGFTKGFDAEPWLAGAEWAPRKIWEPVLPGHPYDLTKSQYSSLSGVPFDKKNVFIFLAAKSGGSQKWNWYQFAREPVLVELGRAMARYPMVQVSVLDGEGSVIVDGEFGCMAPGVKVPGTGHQLDGYVGTPMRRSGYSAFPEWSFSTYIDNWVISSSGPNNDDLWRAWPTCDLSQAFGFSLAPGFLDYSRYADSFVIPILLDLPADEVLKVTEFEVKLVEKTLPMKNIVTTSVWDERDTRKTHPFSTEEGGK